MTKGIAVLHCFVICRCEGILPLGSRGVAFLFATAGLGRVICRLLFMLFVWWRVGFKRIDKWLPNFLFNSRLSL